MPQYKWNFEKKIWTKSCPRCKLVIDGTDKIVSSEIIFTGYFASDVQTVDGFNSLCRDCSAAVRIKHRGGEPVDRKALLEQQGGVCLICQCELTLNGNTNAPGKGHVDHDDSTGIVRGILCGPCNRGIGIFKHDIILLQNAITYLGKFQCAS